MKNRLFRMSFLIAVAPFLVGSAFTQTEPFVFEKGLTISLDGQYGRDAVLTDRLLYQFVQDQFSTPQAGKSLSENSGDGIWEDIETNDQGWFRHRNLRGGYLYLTYTSSKKEELILHVNGHAEVYINGEPRGGDVYSYGWVDLPFQAKRGTNTILIRAARGRVKADLSEPLSEVFLTSKDVLLPDLIRNSDQVRLGAIRVVNATSKWLKGYHLKTITDGSPDQVIEVPAVGPYTSRKVAFKVLWTNQMDQDKVNVGLELLDHRQKSAFLLTDGLAIAIKNGSDKHKETFISGIDGSVQYYSVVPPTTEGADSLALVLTLHGASVEAVNQANAYQAKDWATIVAPTNRRPYGFDWEDWGRWDAQEVLKLARERYQPNQHKNYLTGHSMGGHGTWHLGVTFPGEWAAIGPSAGWYSFWSYAGKETGSKNPIGSLIDQSANASNTLALSHNYINHGVYILHGDQDDNVPVDQARFMRAHLGAFHPDFCYYEEPGAGHWWGNQCVDWPPLFDFLQYHSLEPVSKVEFLHFSTANPGVSSQMRHLEVFSQINPTDFSEIIYHHDTKNNKIRLTTSNVRNFTIDLSSFLPAEPYEVMIDSQSFEVRTGGEMPVVFHFDQDDWNQTEQVDYSSKHPGRSGLFKSAFKNNMVFVYGTQGTKEENTWAYNKARFDAETFWYRGNGSIEILSDIDYLDQGDYFRNVILFGHAEMNKAYDKLLSDCPIQIVRGSCTIGDRSMSGDDIAAYFVYPIQGTERFSVAVIAGSGMEGLRSTYPNRYFVSGSGFPDFMIFKSKMFTDGQDAVVSAGFFDNNWSLSEAFYHIR